MRGSEISQPRLASLLARLKDNVVDEATDEYFRYCAVDEAVLVEDLEEGRLVELLCLGVEGTQ